MAVTATRQARFRDLLYAVAYRLGIKPAGDLHDNDALALTEYLSEAYRFCYEFYPWPDTLLVAQMTVGSNKLVWAEPSGDHQVLGQVMRVTLRHPWTSDDPRDYQWQLGNDGVYLPDLAAGDVYVTWQPRCWPMTLTAYDSAATYAAGDTVYYDGRVYVYTGTVDANPPGSSTEWEELPCPYYLRDAIVAGAHAAKLMEEGQHSTAMVPDQIMEGMLEREMAKLHTFSGRTERYDVVPYSVPS